MDIGEGTLLGDRYRVVERLDSGGMAVVWRGHDEILGRQVAIKVLNTDVVALGQLRSEARVVARLTHPCLTSVHDYGEAGGRPYLVMELLEGPTLREVLAGGRRLPWRRAVAVCADVSAALAEAHARGIVHRDVSASNVMLTPIGVKVLDFGISALSGATEAADPLGTPAYLAPERLRMAEVTAAVDVYAIGVLLYRCLSGRLPWLVDSPTELLEAHEWWDPDPLPPLPGLPAKVADLCRRCLAKDAQARPNSEELAATLSRLAGVRRHTATLVRPVTTDAVSCTTLLPRATFPIPGPAASGAQAASRTRRRSLLVSLGVAAVLLATWGLSSGARPAANWNAAGVPAPPSTGACQVTYQLMRDTGAEFQAMVTVRNRGTAPVQGWQLEFAWPGSQRIRVVQEAAWEQNGRQVVLRPDGARATLPAGGAHQVAVSGDYSEVNALPADFTLGGAACEGTVIGATGPPVVPVVQPLEPGSGNKGKGKGRGKGKGGDDDDDDDD